MDSFTYLGANVTKCGGGTADIRKRIAMAGASFRRLNKIWKVTNISRKFKVSLFKSLVLSVLLYGYKTWEITKTEEKKIDYFQIKCLRRIRKVKWQQHISNLIVLEMAGTSNISVEIRRRKWNWIGHILRKDPADDCAVSLGWSEERRRRGHSKTIRRWMVEVERDKAVWNSWNTAPRKASDRNM